MMLFSFAVSPQLDQVEKLATIEKRKCIINYFCNTLSLFNIFGIILDSNKKCKDTLNVAAFLKKKLIFSTKVLYLHANFDFFGF